MLTSFLVVVSPRTLVIVAIAALALAAAAGPLWLLRPPAPLAVGYISSLSGKYAALGSSARDGALLAVDEHNRRGGRPLRLVVLDDGGEPARAASAAETLAAQGVRLIIGPFTTASATAMLPVLDRCGQLAIGPSVAGSNLAGRDDGLIKLYPGTGEIGRCLGTAALARGRARLACIGDRGNEDYRRTVQEGALAVPGMALAAEVPFAADPDHAALAAQALASRPQAVLVVASAIDTALLCQHLRRADGSVLLLTTPWGVAPELIEHGGGAVEGLLFPQPFDLDGGQAPWRAFVTRFQERFGRAPTHVAALNHEAVGLLAAALADGDEPQAVKRRLLAPGARAGLQEDFTLDASGDAHRRLVLHTVLGGTLRRCE